MDESFLSAYNEMDVIELITTFDNIIEAFIKDPMTMIPILEEQRFVDAVYTLAEGGSMDLLQEKALVFIWKCTSSGFLTFINQRTVLLMKERLLNPVVDVQPCISILLIGFEKNDEFRHTIFDCFSPQDLTTILNRLPQNNQLFKLLVQLLFLILITFGDSIQTEQSIWLLRRLLDSRAKHLSGPILDGINQLLITHSSIELDSTIQAYITNSLKSPSWEIALKTLIHIPDHQPPFDWLYRTIQQGNNQEIFAVIEYLDQITKTDEVFRLLQHPLFHELFSLLEIGEFRTMEKVMEILLRMAEVDVDRFCESITEDEGRTLIQSSSEIDGNDVLVRIGERLME